MSQPTVSVVVPYRPDGGYRAAAWKYVRRWWAATHPGWQVVTGDATARGPWVKALAVADALPRATGDVLVIADADVLCDGVDYAVAAVAYGAPWCVPHTRVHRLTQSATVLVLAGQPLPDPPDRQTRGRVSGPIGASHPGMVGGGMVVLPRTTYERVPIDPRFEGWGQEDAAWGWALTLVAGPAARRGPEPMWHLWHPPAQRLSRAIGSEPSLSLYRRYKACRHPAVMEALLAEATCAASIHPGPVTRRPDLGERPRTHDGQPNRRV